MGSTDPNIGDKQYDQYGFDVSHPSYRRRVASNPKDEENIKKPLIIPRDAVKTVSDLADGTIFRVKGQPSIILAIVARTGNVYERYINQPEKNKILCAVLHDNDPSTSVNWNPGTLIWYDDNWDVEVLDVVAGPTYRVV